MIDMATMNIDGSEFLQTADVAEALGVSVEAINKAIGRKRIRPARKIGNYNLFASDEVERYRTEHLGKRGRRASGKS